ncbi:aldehyde dehydrogenase family protein [Pseudomonas protegens]|uniref:Aldehyde dehydrogenase family protein n=1 Tax=Pseudomonas protegens TaxID=380021 RepID=A0A7G8YMW4_9PSED|nr:aldehyde dehydrogenase family protein [Pseudomonas protegens]QNH77013.1 aldehyde dehydrogenase family protein [Pseudomonas protegens]QNL06208.1 aldehyde dehydrogenase family protein [Pseudomonas protegens]
MNSACRDAVLYFINPGFWPSVSRRTLEVVAPATLERVGVIPLCEKTDVDAAIAAAQAACSGWRKTTVKARGQWLHKVAETIGQLTEHSLQVARLMSAETGRPFSDAMEELAACARVFRHYAQRVTEEARDSVCGSWRHYEPYGVSVHILGGSQPLLLMCRTVAAALAAGNSCIVKPAETATLCTLKFMEYFSALPSGLVACLPGDGLTAQWLVQSCATHVVAFTGGAAAGSAVAVTCAELMKPCLIETGGVAATIVSRHASLDVAAAYAVAAAFRLSGQIGISANRFYVVDEIHDQFVERFAAGVRALRVGYSRGYPEIGPLLSEEARNQVMRLVEDALTKGATRVCGGRIPVDHPVGWFYEPTLLTGLSTDMDIHHEQCFGPVAAVRRVRHLEEALDLANGSPCMRAAVLFSNDVDEAIAAVDRLEAGLIGVNKPLMDREVRALDGWTIAGGSGDLSQCGMNAFRRSKTVLISRPALERQG